jgi:hypothetical protein
VVGNKERPPLRRANPLRETGPSGDITPQEPIIPQGNLLPRGRWVPQGLGLGTDAPPHPAPLRGGPPARPPCFRSGSLLLPVVCFLSDTTQTMKFLIFGRKEGKPTLRVVESNGPSSVKEAWRFAAKFYGRNPKYQRWLEPLSIWAYAILTIRNHREEMMKDCTFKGASRYNQAVYTAWDISYNALKGFAKGKEGSKRSQNVKTVLQIFNLFAFFHNENVIEEIFKRAAESRHLSNNSKTHYSFDYCAELSELLKLNADEI